MVCDASRSVTNITVIKVTVIEFTVTLSRRSRASTLVSQPAGIAAEDGRRTP
jgi:hypothetical protein